MVPEETKHCPKCDQDKPLDTFGKNRSRPDGLQAWCKLCSKKNQRERRKTERKTLLETARQRRLNGEPRIITEFPPEI